MTAPCVSSTGGRVTAGLLGEGGVRVPPDWRLSSLYKAALFPLFRVYGGFGAGMWACQAVPAEGRSENASELPEDALQGSLVLPLW